VQPERTTAATPLVPATRAVAATVLAVAVSAVLDAVLREPPAPGHPVRWAGRYLDRAARHVPAAPPGAAASRGGAAWALGLFAAIAAGLAAERVCRRLPLPAGAVARGVLLWPLWSGRLLADEVAAVDVALDRSLADGRGALARIVSRDTSGLAPAEVRAAAIESLAENLSDSVVAPLLSFAVGGLPAAAAYRYVNTADAMWGYRSSRWEHAGRVAARVDDLANLVPARLTAALLLAGASPATWRRLPGQARRTASPNSGWPMAAVALRLGLRLAKPGAYVLHPQGRAPGPGDVRRALALTLWRWVR
jgi:adenosylcobinamide-phosphate synthase